LDIYDKILPMKKTTTCFQISLTLCLLVALASCKKDSSNNSNGASVNNTPVTATPTKLGLYESDSSIYKLLFIAVPKIGTQTVNQFLIFDTGSGGMVIDAHEILPASMITSTGFNFTGDSTVVNGITITNQTSTIEYGADNTTTEKVYGNLAYASVTVGDHGGGITVKRLPFFLYYKGTDNAGKLEDTGAFDIFGVNSEYDVAFANGAYVTSPFSYFDPGAGLTKGFKMATLGTNNFSLKGTFVPDVLTLGLTSADLGSSSGFTMHTLAADPGYGYSVVLPSSFTYNNKTVSTAYTVFDTGTEPYTYLEDRSAARNQVLLPSGTAVAVNTSNNFNFAYQVSTTDYLTNVENPVTSDTDVSIISLEYFLNNEYLLDYTNHKLGLKNN
jgi:hypothetical protein